MVKDAITDEDRQFMLDEFNLTGQQIRAMSDEEYEELFLKVLEIEADESMKAEETGNPFSERGKRAASIVDKM